MSQVIQDKLTEKTIVSTDKEAPQAKHDAVNEDDNEVINTQESTITNVESKSR